MFKNPNRRSEVIIITEGGNVYYIPSSLTVKETEEILYILYGEYIDWTSTAKRNFYVSTEKIDELTYIFRRYVNQNPEKLLLEVINLIILRAYAEELFSETLWHDIQDAKER